LLLKYYQSDLDADGNRSPIRPAVDADGSRSFHSVYCMAASNNKIKWRNRGRCSIDAREKARKVTYLVPDEDLAR
jgi:hypothetical protein